MDKAMRAIALAEENSAEIAALRKGAARVAEGRAENGHTTFGTVNGTVAIVVFSNTTSFSLISCGKIVATGKSPLIAKIERGTLDMSAGATDARAAIFG